MCESVNLLIKMHEAVLNTMHVLSLGCSSVRFGRLKGQVHHPEFSYLFLIAQLTKVRQSFYVFF